MHLVYNIVVCNGAGFKQTFQLHSILVLMAFIHSVVLLSPTHGSFVYVCSAGDQTHDLASTAPLSYTPTPFMLLNLMGCFFMTQLQSHLAIFAQGLEQGLVPGLHTHESMGPSQGQFLRLLGPLSQKIPAPALHLRTLQFLDICQ